MKLRALTSAEIEKLASRKGVKRIAVENFLGSMHYGDATPRDVYHNIQADAKSYGWNAATRKAIEAGLKLAQKPTREVSKSRIALESAKAAGLEVVTLKLEPTEEDKSGLPAKGSVSDTWCELTVSEPHQDPYLSSEEFCDGTLGLDYMQSKGAS